jgi:hypothetical protein
MSRDIFGMLASFQHMPPPAAACRNLPPVSRDHRMPDMIGMDGSIVPAAALQKLVRRG